MTKKDAATKGLLRRVKQHIIARQHQFFAVVQPGFEQTAATELAALGIEHNVTVVEGGVEFTAKLEECYRVNMACRTISRVIMRIAEFKAVEKDVLRKKVAEIPWELYTRKNVSLLFAVTAKKSRLYHTGMIEGIFLEEAAKRLAAQGAEMFFEEEPVVAERTEQKLIIRAHKDRFVVSIDSSGELLYKRGSKILSTDATLRETTAAALLLEADLEKYDGIIDPMCGSGTFTIEGLSILQGQVVNRDRKFAFFNWPAFKSRNFAYIKKEITQRNRDENRQQAFAADSSGKVVDVAKKNILAAGFQGCCFLEAADFFSSQPQLPTGKKFLLVINPPYGSRLRDNIKKNYRMIGETIRKNYSNCGYAVITPGVEYEKILALPYDKKILFMNGGIKVAVIIKNHPAIK